MVVYSGCGGGAGWVVEGRSVSAGWLVDAVLRLPHTCEPTVSSPSHRHLLADRPTRKPGPWENA